MSKRIGTCSRKCKGRSKRARKKCMKRCMTKFVSHGPFMRRPRNHGYY